MVAINSILKRDGRSAGFDIDKVADAINKAFEATNKMGYAERARMLSFEVLRYLEEEGAAVPGVEHIQDVVEQVLIENGYVQTAKAYILYRAERSRTRDMNSRLMKVYEDITFKSASDSDMKRENANINGDTAMGTMLKYGSEGAKQFYEMFVLKPEHSKAHHDGDIHIHDLDFLTLTTTCCQIDIIKLFKGGFSTGHGTLREPQDIASYAALGCIAIQSNQNDQHGGQSIVNFDYGMALGVAKTFVRIYRENLARALIMLAGLEDGEAEKTARRIVSECSEESGIKPALSRPEAYMKLERDKLGGIIDDEAAIDRVQEFVMRRAEKETDRATYQAMEAFVHNLNTMNSRAGAQTPFSSINYGLDTSPEGRMVIKNVLLATESGLGNGETSIFPIQIFRVMTGISLNEGDVNYDLFKLAIRVSARRMYPNFAFMDAPFNKKYYVPGRPETEIAYMGCRTRVIANEHDPSQEICNGRGNLSFTSINLPRIALKSHKDLDLFFESLDNKINLVIDQLLERYELQAKKKARNYPFLMGEGVWIDSEKLGPDDEVREVLKHGTLSIGFIGLAETLKALTGHHHGESPLSQNLGLEIIGHMRSRLDEKSKETGMNFSLIATPAEGLSGRFVAMDRKIFGSIEGITDREYYTNSFHIPVYHTISAVEKIKLEAPYHAMTNAGHITYVELDGDPLENLEVFEKLIRAMSESGVGYGAINHPVDRDPVCGFSGIIKDQCPGCGRGEEDGVMFDRIRRVTGYLSHMPERFNNAKRAEERDRLKHEV
ncbi:MAG: anaerobic ribonucleoside triphosphate reductase [Oscillospiraceae bacterium]|jgi:ribonucleoside-triphosphate reductase|nr:anaerobic ribonucleoside triphosphate reductase [Oscillospiraceae bacterium]